MIKGIAIFCIVLLGLMDFALVVMCSHMEDREAYHRERSRHGKD